MAVGALLMPVGAYLIARARRMERDRRPDVETAMLSTPVPLASGDNADG
jgi:hypothetical protein